MFDYDVAISFAQDQRPEAEAIAECLRESGATVFYDRSEESELWGKDLYEHLAEIYQKKARYCLMLVSAGYANRVWTNHERKNAQARALSQKGEYILPVRFDDTEIPGLNPAVAYLRFGEHGVQGICEMLRRKLGKEREPQDTNDAKSCGTVNTGQFIEERKRFPDTAVMQKIWATSHWRIWICPTEFRKARFRDIQDCRNFMRSSYFRASGWKAYPWFFDGAVQSGNDWVAGETDTLDGGITRTERWVLCRSGQFVHNRALEQVPQLDGRIHALEILDTVTPAVEFAGRMARRGVLTQRALITFELRSVDGRQLTWPQDPIGDTDAVGRDCWSRDEHVAVGRVVAVQDLIDRSRPLALGFTLELCSRLGWADPLSERLAAEQHRRFGAASVG
jgi:hypothetical protein